MESNIEAKTYEKPAIIHELELESRAGSPLFNPEFDPIHPFGE